jgi:adenine phosphoribosyltransferase
VGSTAALEKLVRDIPEYPKPGVTFKDITPLLGDANGFASTIDQLAGPFVGAGIDRVLGIEARGFIVAAPVAYRLGAGFVPIRKKGKLPHTTHTEEYDLEYGTDILEAHVDAVEPGQRVLVVDDVLATGGTAAATIRLVERLGGVVAGLAFIIELSFLDGRAKLPGRELTSLITY